MKFKTAFSISYMKFVFTGYIFSLHFNVRYIARLRIENINDYTIVLRMKHNKNEQNEMKMK